MVVGGVGKVFVGEIVEKGWLRDFFFFFGFFRFSLFFSSFSNFACLRIDEVSQRARADPFPLCHSVTLPLSHSPSSLPLASCLFRFPPAQPAQSNPPGVNPALSGPPTYSKHTRNTAQRGKDLEITRLVQVWAARLGWARGGGCFERVEHVERVEGEGAQCDSRDMGS